MTFSEFFTFSPSPLQPLHLPWLSSFQQLYVKRDDLLHPIVSGNKWRKLRYVLDDNTRVVVSMGGPYSNHLHALAYLAKQMKWQSHGMIRGHDVETPTLDDCRRWGMQLHFVDRQTYRCLRDDDLAWRAHIDDENAQWLAEGGKSTSAMTGVAELVAELPFTPDVVICASGTGTTVAGIASALPPSSHVIGIAALKNAGFLRDDIVSLLQTHRDHAVVHLIDDLHLGGYARSTPSLELFITTMETNFALPLEPVYTGKVFYALPALMHRGLIHPDQRIVVVHTGGLQGRAKRLELRGEFLY